MPWSASDLIMSGGGQASYIILLTCEEGGHDMRSCSDLGPAQAASCHTRCCQPWQIYHHHSNACVYTKAKYLERHRFDNRSFRFFKILFKRLLLARVVDDVTRDNEQRQNSIKLKLSPKNLADSLAILRGHF